MQLIKRIDLRKFINSFSNDIVKYDRIISNNDIEKEAINFFRKLNCKKFIIAQTTFTDAKFITKFADIFDKPIYFISFKEPRTGKRLRLNSLCGVNLAMHSLMKLNINLNFQYSQKNYEFDKLNNFIIDRKK